MTRFRCARSIVVLSLVFAAATVTAQTRADAPPVSDPARDAALRSLATRLELPLVDEAVAIFSTQLRRTLPAYFVRSLGQNVDLGPQWHAGNAAFDETVRQTDAALAAEEARGGPLLKLDRDDLLLAVNIPWTEDDIRFVNRVLPTALGRDAQRAIDAKAAQQTIATLRRRVTLGPPGAATRQSFADLDARAQSQSGDALLMLLAERGSDPARAQRLQLLIEQVTVLPSDAIGQRITDRLSQRLLNAATNYLPQLLQNLGTRATLR